MQNMFDILRKFVFLIKNLKDILLEAESQNLSEESNKYVNFNINSNLRARIFNNNVSKPNID